MSKGNFIGILSFNKTGLTKRCLDSVLSSRYEPGTVFLYHNGSSRDAREQLVRDYPEINHEYSETNKGYSGGFNSLMKWIFSSGGRSVLFLTNDTIIDPDTLGHCITTERETGSGFIAPAVFYLKYPEKMDSSGGFGVTRSLRKVLGLR